MLAPAKKTDIITKIRTHDSDTGSPEVQIAILSERIGELTEHFKASQEGPWLPPWSAHACVEAPRPSGLPEEDRFGSLSRSHWQAWNPQVVL